MFGFGIITYLFVGGLGGGLCAVSGALSFLVPHVTLQRVPDPLYRKLLAPGFIAAAGFLLMGGLLLLADAGGIGALSRVVLSPRLSYLNIGAWSLMACALVSLVLAALWISQAPLGPTAGWMVLFRLLSGVAVALGLLVALYTGLFLASMKAVPLWYTWTLPALFVASSLSCGLAAFLWMASLSGCTLRFPGLECLLVRADVATIAAEFLVAALFVLLPLIFAGESPESFAARASVGELLWGSVALFWWVFVAAGLVGAFVVDMLTSRGSSLRGINTSSSAKPPLFGPVGRSTALMLLVCAGGYALRAAVVLAGAHPALMFG